MYRFITSILTLAFTISLNAQFIEDECSTPPITYEELSKKPWFGNNEYLYAYLDSIAYDSYFMDINKPKYRVPIKFWVYRSDQGTGGATEADLKQFIRDINQHNINNNTGIVFYMKPKVSYINKTKLQHVNFVSEAPGLTVKNKEKGAVNVHLVDGMFIKKLGGNKRSTSAVFHRTTNGIVLTRSSSNSTLSHEVGHFFGLIHPHENSDKMDKCKSEAVSRTRQFARGCSHSGLICEQSGDGLCDTPAEPMLGPYTNSKCRYIGKIKDPWGDTYKPEVRNIMSYPTVKECRNKFTAGQVAVMLLTAKKYNQSAWLGTQTQYQFDAFEPDNTTKMASEIIKGKVQKHTFHNIYEGKGSKDSYDNIDVLKIKHATAGTITINVKAASGLWLRVSLQKSLGSKLGSTQTNSTGTATLKIPNKAVGTYFIIIEKKSSKSKNNYTISWK